MDAFLLKMVMHGEGLSKFATKPEIIKENIDKFDFKFSAG